MQQRPPPKFSSFAPPAPPTREPTAGASSSRAPTDDEHPSHPHKRRKHDDDANKKHHPRDRDRETSPSHRDRDLKKKGKDKHGHGPGSRRRKELRAIDKIAARPVAAQLEDRTRRPAQYTLTDSGQSFYEDVFGSTGSLYLEVKYWPPGQVRQVLGVPSLLKVSRDIKHHTFEVFIPFRYKTRADVNRQFKAAGRAPTRRLVAPQTRLLKGEEDGFIPVGKSRDDRASSSLNTPAYRSITGPRSPPSDTDTDSDDEDLHGLDSDDEDTTDAYSAETARLSRILQADLSSVPAWLDVIAHSATSNPTPQGRADIWLTMLEKAMDAHPKNAQSDVLRLRYIEAVRDARTPQDESSAWERALLEIQSENLWVEYVSYRLANGGPEGIDEAVPRVSREIERSNLSDERKSRARARVFWRAVIGLREAGFLERATAAVQAQLELTFFTPSILSNTSFEQRLQGLEEFWDSETPRIGEVGAQGWSSWSVEVESGPEPPPSSSAIVPNTSSPPSEASDDGYQRWAAAQAHMDAHGWLPSREDTDDPFSIILFADIRTLLFPPHQPSSSSSPDLTILLLSLEFFGLHIPGFIESLASDDSQHLTGGRSEDSVWSYTSFMAKPNLLGSLFAIPSKEKQSTNMPSKDVAHPIADELIIGRERRMGSGWGPVKYWSLGTRAPLEGHGPRGEGRMWESADMESVDIEFVRRLFQLVDKRLHSEELAEYWIAFEAAVSVKEALKMSKTVLANYPKSLRLWAAHASLQRIRGKADAARKVYETCLTTNSASSDWTSPRDDDALARARMWWSWAEMEWFERQNSAATRILCSVVGVTASDDGSDTRIALLRARKAYDNVLKTASVSQHVKISLLQCLALLELIHTNDVPRLLSIYDDYTPSCVIGGETSKAPFLAEEGLAISSALLIHHYSYTLRNATRPVILRDYANRLIHKFPGNTLLLGVWLESERGEAVWGRVRTGVTDVVLGASDCSVPGVSVARWMWAIWVETWERGVWDSERVRGVLRRALDDTRLRRCPTIWTVRTELELRLNKRSAAHGVIYRATAACPWVKALYMPCFRLSRPQFSADALRNAVNAMAERGLRLRAMHSLESYLEDHDSGTDDEPETGGWGEAEIEYRASELARLKPY